MEKTEDTGQGFAIAALILGVISVVIAFVPFLGLVAILPAGIGAALAIIALLKAKKVNAPKGLIIAGLSICLAAILISGIWGYASWNIARNFKDKIKGIHFPQDSFHFEIQDSLERYDSLHRKKMKKLEEEMERLEKDSAKKK